MTIFIVFHISVLKTLMVFSSVALAVHILRKWFKDPPEYTLPPGPPYFECLQIFKRCLKKFEIHHIGNELAKRYGEIFKITFFGKHLVFVNSVRLAKKLLTSNKYKDFTNDRPLSFVKKVFKGLDIVFSDNNETQTRLRRLVHGVVRHYGDGLKDFEAMINSEVRLLESSMLKSCSEKSFDMDRAFTYSLIRVIHIFLTKEQPEDTDALVNTIETFDINTQLVFRNDNNTALTLFPFLQHLPESIPGSKKSIVYNYMSLREKLLEFYLNPSSKKKLKGSTSLIGHMLKEQENDPENITDAHVQGVVINMIVAAFVTTKGTLSGFFLMMLIYPEIQRKIQEEIDNNIKDRHPVLDDRQNLHYTNATVLEVLRFIRHIPLSIPHSTSQDIEVEGYLIPAHSTLITNLWVILRSKEYYEDPDVFRPERFLDENGKLLPVDHPSRQVLSLAFGAGKRNCLGESFAKSRIFLFVTSLLQKFTFSPGDNVLPSKESGDWKPTAALCPAFLNCVVEKRQK